MSSCTYKFYESKAVHIPLKYLTKIQKKNTSSQTTAVFKNHLQVASSLEMQIEQVEQEPAISLVAIPIYSMVTQTKT